MADEDWRNEIRICPICGDSFKPSRYNQKFCKKTHYHKCPVCGKIIETKNQMYPHQNDVCCSKKCAAIHKKETCIKKYGGPAPACNKEIQEKSKQTCIKNFGVEFPAQNKYIKEKQNESYLKNFGKSENPEGYKSKLDKTKATCMQRYGKEFVTQTEQFKQVSKQSSNLRYNVDYPMQAKNVQEKYKNSMLAKYGVSNPMKLEEVKDKLQKTNESKYGYPCTFSNPVVRKQISESIESKYGVPWYCMSQECISKNRNGSNRNREIQDKLNKLGIDWEAEFCIENRLFDFYLPKYSILLEIDPSYTHSTIKTHWGTCISASYHEDKSNLAAKHGYRCMHIFDWDDEDKILCSLIVDKTLAARKCEIHTLSNEVVQPFLNTNHYQSSCRGQIVKLGLYYDEQLVEVMSFGKPRYNKNYEWELLRLCTKTHYKVIGGASKLFEYFIKLQNPSSIISYCNCSKFNGDVYYKLGMSLKSKTSPSKTWSKGKSKITDNLLRQRGYDQLFNTHYGKGSSNDELMLEHGWLPVFDCGQKVFEWRR